MNAVGQYVVLASAIGKSAYRYLNGEITTEQLADEILLNGSIIGISTINVNKPKGNHKAKCRIKFDRLERVLKNDTRFFNIRVSLKTPFEKKTAMHDICFVNLPWSATARLRKVSLQLPHLSVFSLIKRVFRDAHKSFPKIFSELFHITYRDILVFICHKLSLYYLRFS